MKKYSTQNREYKSNSPYTKIYQWRKSTAVYIPFTVLQMDFVCDIGAVLL